MISSKQPCTTVQSLRYAALTRIVLGVDARGGGTDPGRADGGQHVEEEGDLRPHGGGNKASSIDVSQTRSDEAPNERHQQTEAAVVVVVTFSFLRLFPNLPLLHDDDDDEEERARWMKGAHTHSRTPKISQ